MTLALSDLAGGGFGPALGVGPSSGETPRCLFSRPRGHGSALLLLRVRLLAIGLLGVLAVCVSLVVCGLGGLGWVGLAATPVPSPSCGWGCRGRGCQRHRGSGPGEMTSMGHDHHRRCAAAVGIGLGPWKDPDNGFAVVCLPRVPAGRRVWFRRVGLVWSGLCSGALALV